MLGTMCSDGFLTTHIYIYTHENRQQNLGAEETIFQGYRKDTVRIPS